MRVAVVVSSAVCIVLMAEMAGAHIGTEALPIGGPARTCGVTDDLAGAQPRGGPVFRRALAREKGELACGRDCGQTVVYRSWKGREYVVQRFVGRHVEMFFPQAWFDQEEFDPETRRSLVDGADLTYQYLKDLVGREPSGAGRLPIAFVEVPGCGYGCGYIGRKGVEIGDDLSTTNAGNTAAWREAVVGLAQNAIIHEMTHNFDVFWAHYSYVTDAVHYWTHVVNGSLWSWSRFGASPHTFTWADLSPEEFAKNYVDYTFGFYRRTADASWQRCVRSATCGVQPREAAAGVFLRVAQLHGPLVLPRFLAFLRQFAASRPVPSSAEAKEDLLMEALSAGAGADLGCVADQLRWWMGTAARQRVAARYPRSPICADADGDGSSVLLGDPDDHDPARHSGALEVRNGVDDDGDDAIDEVLLEGPLSTSGSAPTPGGLPVEVRGRAIPGRREYVSLGDLAAGQRLLISICVPLDAPALIGAIAPGSPQIDISFLIGGCSSFVARFDRASRPLLWIAGYQTPTDFLAFVRPGSEWPLPPWGTVGHEQLPDGAHRLTLATGSRDQFIAEPDSLRWWVSGAGWVGQTPFSDRASLIWRGQLPGGNALSAVRAQPYRDGYPVARPTLRTWTGADGCGPEGGRLCLAGGRYEASATWRNPYSGEGGAAGATPYTDFTGFLHFGDRANTELLVKVLPLGDRAKVFIGQLTDFDYTITVTDRLTGATREYASRGPACGTLDDEGFPITPNAAHSGAVCVPSATTLCLLDGRMELTASWTNQYDGSAGTASVRPLSGYSGTFSFGDPANVELVAKALQFGDRLLVLYGALSDLGFTLRARDTVSGLVREYANPSGRYCGGLDEDFGN